MPPFVKPEFTYNYQVEAQINALRRYRDEKPGRRIPEKVPDKLLLATWNIANLGVQERRDKDARLLAEIVSWFDLIAIQEVNDDLSGLMQLMAHLPGDYKALFSDAAGNNERMAFLYDATKVELLSKVGEVAIAPASLRHIRLEGIEQKFRAFDRSPYLAGFQAGNFRFVLANVHLYFGSFNNKEESTRSMNRRRLETYAVARWADLRRKSDNSFARDIIALGDFNLPRAEPGDPIYDALTKRGLRLPDHSSRVGSSIASESNYDQIAFFPGETEAEHTGEGSVFDFDGAVFETLWENRGETDFNAYVRYYLSDHRPMWAQFQI
jgi:endonuclease/exonuclease/phosphatase family metal-dependent hydrolase